MQRYDGSLRKRRSGRDGQCGADAGGGWVIDFAVSLLGIGTFLVLWGALPLWIWWFQTRIVDYLPDDAQGRGRAGAGIGAVLIVVTLWLVWRYVLPDWWIVATPMIVTD